MIERSELIEALSWHEDMDRGRWGVEYAAAVLEAHEARVRAEVASPCASASKWPCYPCSRGEHSDCRGIAWQPDIPCDCPHNGDAA